MAGGDRDQGAEGGVRRGNTAARRVGRVRSDAGGPPLFALPNAGDRRRVGLTLVDARRARMGPSDRSVNLAGPTLTTCFPRDRPPLWKRWTGAQSAGGPDGAARRAPGRGPGPRLQRRRDRLGAALPPHPRPGARGDRRGPDGHDDLVLAGAGRGLHRPLPPASLGALAARPRLALPAGERAGRAGPAGGAGPSSRPLRRVRLPHRSWGRGRRLPRPPRRGLRRARGVAARARRPGARPPLRRPRLGHRPRRRRARRARLRGQERLPAHPRGGLLRAPRRGAPLPATAVLGAVAARLRQLPRLSPGVPDRRHHRPGGDRLPALHQLPDHRAPRRHPRRDAPADRHLGVRLRPLPGGVPGELPARPRRARPGRAGDGRRAGAPPRSRRLPRARRGGVPTPLPAHRGVAHRPRRAGAERRHRPRQRGRPRRSPPAAAGGGRRPRSGGAGGGGLGDHPARERLTGTIPAMQGLDRRLAERTLELVDIASESGDEARILEHVAGVLAGVDGGVHADADGLLLVPPRSGRSLVVLAGHLDTVPAQGNRPGHVEDGAIVGLGASDMKGACAVILELALWADRARPQRAVDLGFLLFGREELPSDRSALRPLLARLPMLGETALAVVMEPTDNTLQVGCLGNLTAEVRFTGRSAHSARPWLGVNAVHAAVQGLAGIAALPPQPVVIQGLEYREVVSVVRISAGIADNVIPDLATCRINYRYAPDRTPAAADARLRALLPGAELRVLSNSCPAPVVADP